MDLFRRGRRPKLNLLLAVLPLAVLCFHASYAIIEELARDPSLSAFDPNMADILVIPANEVPPSPGNEGEAIVDGLVVNPVEGVDDQHLGN